MGALVCLAFLAFGCGGGEPNPIPAGRDARLVGQWKQVGGLEMILEFNADGAGQLLAEGEEGDSTFKVTQWGTANGVLGIARPSTDTGMVCEQAHYEVSEKGDQVTLGAVQVFLTSNDKIIKSPGGKASVLTSPLKRREAVAGGADQAFGVTPHTPAKLAILEQTGDRRWMLTIHRPSHQPVTFASGSTPPKWSPDGKFLAYQASGDLWLFDETLDRPRRLVAVPDWSAIDWSPDGRFLFYSAQPRGPGTDSEAMAYELKTGGTRRLDYGPPLCWSADGERALSLHIYGNHHRDRDGRYEGERADGAVPTDVVMLDRNLKFVRRVTSDGWYGPPEFLDENRVLLRQLGTEPSDGAGAPTHFFVLDLSTGKRRALELPWDVEGYWTAVSPNGRTLAATADTSNPTLYLVDLETGASKAVAKDVYCSDLAWTRDGKYVFFEKLSSEPKNYRADTEQVFKLDVATGKAEQVSHQPRSYSYFAYDNAHGTVIYHEHAFLYQTDERAKPVLLLHGVGTYVEAIAAWWE
ncbi:MAG: hypothetical protein M9921_12855 [Fimbriimonadaceae bacterium]|nr:hypothetical protein [Fimbriimonadaceae bacterium]